MISVPVVNPETDELAMTLQLETDVEMVPKAEKTQKSSFGQGRHGNDSPSLTGMTFMYGNSKKSKEAIGGWSKADFVIS